MKKSFFKMSMTMQILLALILSIIVGYFMQDYQDIADNYIRPFGNIFLNLLKFIVVPLVFFSIISGMISFGDVKKIGKLGVGSLVYFGTTTIFAVILGLIISTLLKDWFPLINITFDEPANQTISVSFIDQLVNFFPKNIIEPMANTIMMQIIVMAILFGVAICHVGEKGDAVKNLIISMNEVVTKIMSYILLLSPIGIFCMMTPVVAKNGPQVLSSYAVLIATAYLCFFVHLIIVYVSCVKVLGKMSPFHFFKEMAPAMLFAYSSDSSVATLPYTMKSCEQLGVKKDLSSFVLSLGATINMDGVAIYLGVTSVFIATCCGIDLTMQQYLAIALSSTIASVGTPGIPGGSLALMAMVFASSGIPIEGVAIAAGIDRIVDMGRTTMSITGDASCAVVLQRILGKQIE